MCTYTISIISPVSTALCITTTNQIENEMLLIFLGGILLPSYFLLL